MTASKKVQTVTADDPADRTGRLKRIGGSISDAFNNVVAVGVLNTLWTKHSDTETRERQFAAATAALMGIAPRDELEGMLAGQLIAANAAAMEAFRRAMLAEQTFDGRKENLTQANKLSRTYANLLEALNRHRGKGTEQKVTVEHVHVHPGGQAIVGAVQTRGGGGGAIENRSQPHAKGPTYDYADAPEPALRGKDPERDERAVPRASDAERPLPDARRHVPRRSKG